MDNVTPEKLDQRLIDTLKQLNGRQLNKFIYGGRLTLEILSEVSTKTPNQLLSLLYVHYFNAELKNLLIKTIKLKLTPHNVQQLINAIVNGFNESCFPDYSNVCKFLIRALPCYGDYELSNHLTHTLLPNLFSTDSLKINAQNGKMGYLYVSGLICNTRVNRTPLIRHAVVTLCRLNCNFSNPPYDEPKLDKLLNYLENANINERDKLWLTLGYTVKHLSSQAHVIRQLINLLIDYDLLPNKEMMLIKSNRNVVTNILSVEQFIRLITRLNNETPLNYRELTHLLSDSKLNNETLKRQIRNFITNSIVIPKTNILNEVELNSIQTLLELTN